MPELPEVETIVRGLKSSLVGHKIVNVFTSNKKMRLSIQNDFHERILDSCIQDVQRKAKYILIFLDNEEIIIIHLGMSGRILLADEIAHNIHNHCIIALDNEIKIIFYDPRRFGFYTLIHINQFSKFFQNLGVEPLSNAFNAEYIKKICFHKNMKIKNILMENKFIVGIGNIYVSEALFMAGIMPLRSAKTLSLAEYKKLFESIVTVLNKAIKSGGSTLKDYRKSDGVAGSFQDQFMVYGRESKGCKNCNNAIKNIKISGRSSYYCPSCQL